MTRSIASFSMEHQWRSRVCSTIGFSLVLEMAQNRPPLLHDSMAHQWRTKPRAHPSTTRYAPAALCLRRRSQAHRWAAQKQVTKRGCGTCREHARASAEVRQGRRAVIRRPVAGLSPNALDARQHRSAASACDLHRHKVESMDADGRRETVIAGSFANSEQIRSNIWPISGDVGRDLCARVPTQPFTLLKQTRRAPARARAGVALSN